MTWELLPNGSICEATRRCGCRAIVRPAGSDLGTVSLHVMACSTWHTQASERARERILAGDHPEPQDLLASWSQLLDEETLKPYVKPPLHRDPIFVICHRQVDLPDPAPPHRTKTCCDCHAPVAVLLSGLLTICVRPVLTICEPCSQARIRMCGGMLAWTYNVKPCP